MPQPQFILLIEPDDDSRVMYATDADVIVTGIRTPGSRTPKCEAVYCRVMVL